MHSKAIESPPQVATASKPAAASKEPLPPWAKVLPVQPGESLKTIVDDGKDKQVVTFFQVTDRGARSGEGDVHQRVGLR